MNKHIKEIKRRRIKNRKFIKRYPFAQPYDWFGWRISPKIHKYDFTAWDDIPQGWRRAFGNQLAEDLMAACKESHVPPSDLGFIQIKEKYGSLRMYPIRLISDKIDRVIDDYGYISEYCCIYCGRPDVGSVSSRGWIFPACKTCYQKMSIIGTHTKDEDMENSYQIKHWTKNGTEIEERYVGDKIERIRKRYRTKKNN